MEIVAAIDSFKGSMTSVQAGKAAAKGIHKVDPEAKVHVRPLADGGEGTVEALVSGMNGTIRKVSVTGPIGKTVVCEYGVIENTGGKTEEKTAPGAPARWRTGFFPAPTGSSGTSRATQR